MKASDVMNSEVVTSDSFFDRDGRTVLDSPGRSGLRSEGRSVGLHGLITDDRMRTALCVIAENVRGARSVRDHMVCIEPISGAVVSQGSRDERTAL